MESVVLVYVTLGLITFRKNSHILFFIGTVAWRIQ
jgi:hypothetical protein